VIRIASSFAQIVFIPRLPPAAATAPLPSAEIVPEAAQMGSFAVHPAADVVVGGLFGAFTQADQSITRRFGGTGLGLSTVYGIVKQSGGHIFVDSAPGHGATFRVFLPYAVVADDADHTPAANGTVSLGRERVLVVDDDEAVRRATERALVSRGFTVLVARGASEALALAVEPFDAVLADLVMPEFGGDALVERLRQARPGLPAVVHLKLALSRLNHEPVHVLARAGHRAPVAGHPQLGAQGRRRGVIGRVGVEEVREGEQGNPAA